MAYNGFNVPKLIRSESEAVAENVRKLLKFRGWKLPALAAKVVGTRKPRELHNFLRRLRPRLKGQRAFCWDDLPDLMRALEVSRARLLWAGNGKFHTGSVNFPDGVKRALTRSEHIQVEDAVADRRRFLYEGKRMRLLFGWTTKWDQPGLLKNVARNKRDECQAEDYARVVREKWDLGLHPIASLPWLFAAAGGVHLKLDRPDFDGWPGLAPFHYNSDRIVVTTAGYAALPLARQRFLWARAMGSFVNDGFLAKDKLWDRFARALLVAKELRRWYAGIRHKPAEREAFAEIFGVDEETLKRRQRDWRGR